MKKTGLIGLGTIVKNYAEGLKNAPYLALAAVCDLSPEAVSRPWFGEYPFYTDYREMVRVEGLDYVIISTPPQFHYEIAMWALSQGVNVIVEKPATLNLADCEALVAFAAERGLVFEVMYHWQTGSEVVAFCDAYKGAEISRIHVAIYDHYSANGKEIDDPKTALGGAWVDSGVNALSMLKRWLPFDRVLVESIDFRPCLKTGKPIYVDVRLLIDGVAVDITVDWRHDRSDKTTALTVEGREVLLDHSAQRIVDGERIIRCDDMERLPRHYFNYFTGFGGAPSTKDTLAIHRVLFAVEEQL